VLIETGHPYFAASAGIMNYYRLAYSSISEELISEGVKRIAHEIDQLTRH
jgi:GntR family transcriptional regulator/MocR family aminotransferase